MTAYARLVASLEDAIAPALMPTLARLVFAGTLLVYYWNSARTKLGEGLSGLWNLDFGAYTQILPRVFEKFERLGRSGPDADGDRGRRLPIAGHGLVRRGGRYDLLHTAAGFQRQSHRPIPHPPARCAGACHPSTPRPFPRCVRLARVAPP